ncbi:unnamed protein product [Rotaria sordida]|uniref:Uncharacterized protein n=1 Tax=Rotaria sordida TaxID=392033 RepID=A0A819XJ40_9BILA|nr:unnamed protein product [Rotaria sordida]
METSASSKEASHTNVDDKRLDLFCLLWLDINVYENRDIEQKLRSITNDLRKFYDVKQCQEYIEQTSEKDRFILIVSGSLGREIVPSIHKYPQIISIYIYCVDKEGNEQWSSKYSKVKGVVVHHDDLVLQIKTEHQIQKQTDELLLSDVSNAAQSVVKYQNMDESKEDNFDEFFIKFAEYVVTIEYKEYVGWVLFHYGSLYVQPMLNDEETSKDELIRKATEHLSKVLVQPGGPLGDILVCRYKYENGIIYCGMIGSFEGIIIIHPSTRTMSDMSAIRNSRVNILNDQKNPIVITTGNTKQNEFYWRK